MAKNPADTSMAAATAAGAAAPSIVANAPPPRQPCGVVMPISAIDGCDEHHWGEVKGILFDAIAKANLKPDLVSDAEDIGVIQARIVNNLYYNPIVVCDVSAKNANVMFELGLRLAFDRPTIIVIDDKTPFSFDTSPIEHLKYPRDLRYGKIQSFKEKLTEKILAVLEKAKEPDYSTFLRHFGSFTASKLDKKELAPEDFIAVVTQKLTGIEEGLSLLRKTASLPRRQVIGEILSEDLIHAVRLVRVKRTLEKDRYIIVAEPSNQSMCGKEIVLNRHSINGKGVTCPECQLLSSAAEVELALKKMSSDNS